MKNLRTVLTSACLIGLSTSPSFAIDCGAIKNMDQYEQFDIDPQAFADECLGNFDPPDTPDIVGSPGDLNTGLGSSSVSTQGQNAPEIPPGLANAPPSVSNSKWGMSLSLPPWQGFPCQLPGGTSICGGGSSNGGNGGSNGGNSSGGPGGGGASCPPRDDTSPTFGERIGLANVTGQALPCGGTVTLGATQYSLIPGANRLAIFDFGATAIKLYVLKNVTVPTTTGGTTTITRFEADGEVPVPRQLCKPTGPMGAMEKSIDLPPPMAQVFAYKNDTPRLIVRLLPNADAMPYDPFQPDEQAEPEKFLILPIVDKKPADLVATCGKETDLYKPNPPATADIDIYPVAQQVCDVTTLYPSSTNCSGKMLVAVADDPLLVHEPERTAKFYPLSDRSENMAESSIESVLMMQPQSAIRIGASGLKFTLPEGGVLPLKDGKFLRMNGPVDIMGSARSISLRGGGQIEDGTGAMVSSFSPNSTVTPNAELPYLIRPTKKIIVPAGLIFPTKPGGHIRLPVNAQ